MDNLEALRALEPKVADGAAGLRDFEAVWNHVVSGKALYAIRAYNEDMNAALSLLFMVPDWEWTVSADSASLYRGLDDGLEDGFSEGRPARALLLAIIRALIWEAENEGDGP